MSSSSTHVVLLRSPREDDPYEAAFRVAGLSVRCEPVLVFEPVNQEVLRKTLSHPHRYAGLVLTSPRAVEALDDALVWLPGQSADWESKPAFAVGPRTAGALRALGFAPEGQESGTAEDLAAHIARLAFDKPLLFLCGNRRRDVLPRQLQAAGMEVKELCVYETHLRADLDLGETPPDWLVFFSPSGVEAVEQAVSIEGLDRTRKAAIGPTTARAFERAGWQAEAVADAPTPEALVDAMQSAADTTSPR